MHPENTVALHWSGVYVHIFICIIDGSLNLKDVFHALNIDIHLLIDLMGREISLIRIGI